MIDYKKLYSELGGVGNVSPELAYEARGLERAKGSLFDSSHPLAFDNAQNTAQRAKDKSDELQEAFKFASSGDFKDMFKFDSDKSKIGYQSTGYEIDPAYQYKKQMQEFESQQRNIQNPHYSQTDYQQLIFGRGLHSFSGVPLSSEMPQPLFFSTKGGYKMGEGQQIPQTKSSNVAGYGYTPHEITTYEQQRRQDEETPWWKKPQDSTPDWLKQRREKEALAAANAANKK